MAFICVERSNAHCGTQVSGRVDDAERAVLKSMSVSDDRATITIGFRDITTEYRGKCRLGRSKAGVAITACGY